MDFALSTTGDLQITPAGDLLLIGDEQAIRRQELGVILLTNAPDYLVFPDFGANLEDLLGRTADRNTLDLGEELIAQAVPDLDEVNGVPNEADNAIVFFIRHSAFEGLIALVFAMDRGIIAGEDGERLLHEALQDV